MWIFSPELNMQRTLSLLPVGLLAFAAIASALEYNDDTTTRKVQLVDLENEQEERQHLQQQQLPYYSPSVAQVSAPQQSLYKNHRSQYQPATTANDYQSQSPAPPTSGPTAPSLSDYDSVAAAHPYNLNGAQYQQQSLAYDPHEDQQQQPGADSQKPASAIAAHYQHNVLPLAVQQAIAQRQQQQQQQQEQQYAELSAGYELRQRQGGIFVLMPSYEAEMGPQQGEEEDDVDGAKDSSSDEQNLQQSHQQHLPTVAYFPVHAVYKQQQYRQPLPPTPPQTTTATTIVPFNRPTASTYAAGGSTTLATLQQHLARFAPGRGGAGGVRYVDNNQLGNGDEGEQGEDAFLPSHYHRPSLIYGTARAAPTALPTLITPRPLLTHSKQHIHAPFRSEDKSLPPYATIPYPPSFISFTSTAATPTQQPGFESSAASRPFEYGRYKRPFKPSQVDPLPDLFHNRQAKSLLDSYIPSWVVATMLQQRQLQQPRHVGGAPLSYTAAIPYRRHYKRQLSIKQANSQKQKQQQPAKMQGEKTEKVVKKALQASTTDLPMTA